MPNPSNASVSSSIDRAAVAQALYRERPNDSAARRCAVNQVHGEQDLAATLWSHLEIGPGGLLVDVGCGSGEIMERFHAASGGSVRVAGVDFSTRAVLAARRNALDAVVADAGALPLRDGIADGVTCNFAVYYFGDLARVLAEFRRVATAGATILVSGPASDSNLELYAFHQEATGSGPSDADRMALGYVANVVPPALAIAGCEEVRVHSFENRVAFPSVPEFLSYWEATSLFQRTPGASVATGARVLAHRADFTVTKRVTIVTARRA